MDDMQKFLAAELSRRELLKKWGLVGSGIVLAPSLGAWLSACGGGGGGGGTAVSGSPTATSSPKPGGTLTMGHIEEIGSLDPKVWAGFAAIVIQSQIYETLIYTDPVTGKATPNLATSWEQPDPVTWVYKIRQGVTFHNGAPLSAADVAYTFNRIADPKQGAWEQYVFANYKYCKAVDAETVEMKLKKPDYEAQFIAYFQGGFILNEKYAREMGDKLGNAPMGTGPFQFVSRDPSVTVVKRFDGYWQKPYPYLDGVEFRNIKDTTTIMAALRNGEVQLTYDVPKDQISVVEGFDQVVTQTAPGWDQTFLNLGHKAPFDDVKVRQAIRYAIDTPTALASFDPNYVEPATGAIVPEHVPYSAYKELQGNYKQDVAKAKQLMAESTVPNGFSCVMAVNPGGLYDALALSIQQQLAPIGIKAEIKKLPAPDTIALEYSHDFDMVLAYWIADYPDISSFLLQWYSGNAGEGGPNFTEFRNADYDMNYETAMTTSDDTKRAEAFRQCQLILAEYQPSVILAFPKSVRFQSAKLAGTPVAPFWTYDSYKGLGFTS